MSIFGSIVSAIFGHSAAATTPSPTVAPGKSSTVTPGAPSAHAPGASATAKPSALPPQTVDIAAIVDKAAAASGENLDWRNSIVDLMKAFGLDSGLTARRQLAKELNYTGNTNDSASMNLWLHRQVMAKLAANGGKLPVDIKV